MWKDIPWTEGKYQVSDDGLVRGPKKKVLAYNYINSGYAKVYICINGKRYSKLVHRLVAEAFLDDYSDKLLVDHINNNKLDNRVENLQMMTHSENIAKAYRDGLNYISEYQLQKIRENARKNIIEQGQPIAQYSLNDELIAIFHSKSEARRKLGVHISCITKAANNDTVSYGYKWKWVDKSVTTIPVFGSSLSGETPLSEAQEP